MTAEPGDIVPFGKYRGRPVVDLIADRSYTDWLASQPWFRQRYGTVYNLIINTGSVPQDSPEHNAMQARFLDHDEALRLCSPVLLDREQLLERWHSGDLTSEQSANLVIPTVHTSSVATVEFESMGWDLLVSARTHIRATEVDSTRACVCECDPVACARPWSEPEEELHNWSEHYNKWTRRREKHCAPVSCPATWINDNAYYRIVDDGLRSAAVVVVELKPTVGDDYPSVLREVIKRREMSGARGRYVDHCVVLADAVTFTSVDLDKVKKIYRSQRVQFMTTAELPQLGPAWQCACRDCSD